MGHGVWGWVAVSPTLSLSPLPLSSEFTGQVSPFVAVELGTLGRGESTIA
jgi:hypothetical protein